MSAPLTTRDTLADALRAAWSPDWANRPNEVIFDALADALIASGALTDATKLAEEVARIRQWLWKASQGDHTRIREAGIMQEACAQLDAALSARSERAEVER